MIFTALVDKQRSNIEVSEPIFRIDSFSLIRFEENGTKMKIKTQHEKQNNSEIVMKKCFIFIYFL